MGTRLKRFTISLTTDMEAELKAVRKKYFGNITQNGMMKELIRRGLKAVAADGGIEKINTCDHLSGRDKE
mgnify:CR=1 FL=1